MQISDFKDKNIHVLGASSQEGRSAIRFLDKVGAVITSHDKCKEEDFEKNYLNFSDYIRAPRRSMEPEFRKKDFDDFMQIDFEQKFEDEYLDGIEDADGVFLPQAWFKYDFNEALLKLRGEIPFYSTTDVMLNFSKAKTIGVTGTNGKSTTTRIIESILKQTGKKIWFSGNDRELEPMAHHVFDMKEDDFLVLEISNRQLTLTTASPHIAAITNISPNHLDDHGTFENYIEAKKNIFKFQEEEDFAVVNFENEYTKKFSRNLKSKVVYFAKEELNSDCGWWSGDNILIKAKGELIELKNIKTSLIGEHNRENILTAAICTYLAGVSIDDIQNGVEKFEGSKNRLEFVKEVNGVNYYNDSQSTSPASLVSAIQSFDSPMVLIAGGFRKNILSEHFQEVADVIRGKNIKKVFLLDIVGDVISELLSDAGIDFQKVKSLDEAVSSAGDIASRGDVVLMSPGAESFGMFKDYRERGQKFKDLVDNL